MNAAPRPSPLAATHPELVEQWIEAVSLKHKDKSPDNTSSGSGIRVLWRCTADWGHTWEAQVRNRSRGQGCPHCHRLCFRPLIVVRPELAAQWIRAVELESRAKTPKNTGVRSDIIVLWRCAEDPEHTWEASVCRRIKSPKTAGCPHCPRENSIRITDPELSARWIRTVNSKDKGRTPDNTSFGSCVRVLWRCTEYPEHAWEATVCNRTAGQGCTHCKSCHGNPIICSHPELVSQWVRVVDSDYPDKTPQDTGAGSRVRVLWRCPKDPEHTWEARVKTRSRGKGCPICASQGWDKPYLAHFLQKNLTRLQRAATSKRRRQIFDQERPILTAGKPRVIIESIIENKLSDDDVQSYISGEPTVRIQRLLDEHSPHNYGGKDQIPALLRRAVYARDNYTCLACGSTEQLSCDHYPLPESRGGKTVIGNLRTLCISCNCASGTDSLTEEQIRKRRGLYTTRTRTMSITAPCDGTASVAAGCA